MGEWRLEPTETYIRDLQDYSKKCPEELAAVLNNLDTYFRALFRLGNPMQITGGFIHNESDGIKGIDQKGSKRKLTETRLYVYPDTHAKRLYLLMIGTKKAQRQDISNCRDVVRKLRKTRGY